MKMTISFGAAVMAALLVSGCATKPDPDSFGGRLQLNGGELAEIGEKWAEGDALIIKGRAAITDGEDDIDDGESLISAGKKKVRNGRANVEKGERMKLEAEETYRLRAPTGTALQPAS